MINRKLLIAGVIIIVALVAIIRQPTSSTSSVKKSPQLVQISPNDKPQIVSTKPDPLEENLVSGTETVEITFNRPLENVGEFKFRIEPKIDIKAELSGDRRTAKITPVKPYPLGTTFTLFIGTETKFDGVGRWGEEKIYHFKTITYRGV